MYGIPNCDTIKKARKWLHSQDISFDFFDYKKSGADETKLREWAAQVGWEILLNTRGTTFRKLSDAEKTGLDLDKAVGLMCANPSMIKRPVLEGAGPLLVGFKPEAYGEALG
jgi:Spx/MgsR family transcriptional regulator